MQSNQHIKLKVCPLCHNSFYCGPPESCWCNRYRISKEKLQILKKSYPDCLCPDCLSKYAEEKSA
ncbi:MAG: cysteine-rich CWC family protein [Bacteroidales bacterium]|nr:cysteine-rich CWC family protein [Bacteroidales bacterium]MCF8344713.1 cysteine-rich CWC family protein [Bacteroidales bacterium]MCF8376308.1 cysteine-rich CWC family protein [Bacteroidales bacterium]MCF8401001.1 cysteine-rich CWC family protein [Bacteroidales bacterium]